MYSEEETELRDLIMQNLENCGFLNKIKAEIRAGVFLALEEDGNLKTKIPILNQKFDDFINTAEGKLTVSLIREFLVYYSLNFTLSIFDPEVASPSYISRSELCDQLNVKTLNEEEPLLVTLLKGIFEVQNLSSSNKSSEDFNSSYKPSKSPLTDTTFSKDPVENLLKQENDDDKKKMAQSYLESNSTANSKNDLKDTFNASNILSTKDWETSKVSDVTFTDIFKEKDAQAAKNTKSSIFKEPTNLPYKDPFFDDPIPTEKTSYFSFSETSKEKPENVLPSNSEKDVGDAKKSSLTSLKDLPSLTANHEWTFSRDKNTLPNLDSLKSISSSEASNEEIINLDPKDIFEKKDSDVAESNEESSEKQISESTEEEIEEDFSANIDDLYNNSLSLAEDETTDQTVSQVSVVEGVDHVEPCK